MKIKIEEDDLLLEYKYSNNAKLKIAVIAIIAQGFISGIVLTTVFIKGDDITFYISTAFFVAILMLQAYNLLSMIVSIVKKEVYGDRVFLLNRLFPDIDK